MGKKKCKKNCRKYFVIYQITNLINKMIYVGKHWTYTPYDLKNYWGSSKWLTASIKKNGKENFHRETLHVFETDVEAYLKEKEIVNTEFVKRGDTYNLIVGGRGTGSGENNPRYGVEVTKNVRKKLSIALKGRIFTDEWKKKMSVALTGENNPSFGKSPSEESRIKSAITQIGAEVFYQRLRDIEEIDKEVYGWRVRLSEKWCVLPNTARCFVKRWYKEQEV